MLHQNCKYSEDIDEWFYYKKCEYISIKKDNKILNLYYYDNDENWVDYLICDEILTCDICITKAFDLVKNQQLKCEKCDDIFRWKYEISTNQIYYEDVGLVELYRNKNGTWVARMPGLNLKNSLIEWKCVEWNCIKCINSANSLMIEKTFYNLFLFTKSSIYLPFDVLKLIVDIYFGYIK